MTGAVRVAVGVVFDAIGRVLVGQRPRGSLCAGKWEFPGGKLQDGENAYQALCRELDEELGIEVLDAVPLLVVSHAYAQRNVILDVWRIVEYHGEPRGREAQRIEWVVPRAILDLDFLPANRPILRALETL